MPVLEHTSIHLFYRFPTAVHSGKMYIRHRFRYGQLVKLICTQSHKKSTQLNHDLETESKALLRFLMLFVLYAST